MFVWDGGTGREPGYVDTSFGLRPPRIAIVVPGDGPHWTYFARKALSEANRFWGGSGFVVVPHQRGMVTVTILRAVAAYDPDYVVTLPVTWRELVDYVPNALAHFTTEEGDPVTREWIEDLLDEPVASDIFGESARRTVSELCQVYRMRSHPLDGPDTLGTGHALERNDIEGDAGAETNAGHGADAGTGAGKQSKVPAGSFSLPRWDRGWEHPDESATTLEGPHNTPVAALGVQDEMCLAAPADLGGVWGLATAALVGAVRPPAPPIVSDAATHLANVAVAGEEPPKETSHLETSPEESAPMERAPAGPAPEETSPDDALADLCGWLYRSFAGRGGSAPLMLAHHPRDLALGVNTSTLRSAWTRAATGLTRVHDGFSGEQATIVVGDTADDFALWLIFHRVWGGAVWLHSAWSVDAPGQVGASARSHSKVLSMALSQMRRIVVTSASKDAASLAATAEPLTGPAPAQDASQAGPFGSTGGRRPARRERAAPTTTIQVPPKLPSRGLSHLALADDFSRSLTLPALIGEDALEMTTTPPALAPSNPTLAVAADLAWHVDIGVEGSLMPRGRGLDGSTLAASQRYEGETYVRSGTRSVSYENRKLRWVAAGANAEQRLARPRLRFLSLAAWSRAMASQAGYEVAWSDAGRRAKLLEGMWGDRRALIHDFAGNLFELTELFNRTGKSSKDAYPAEEGVFIAGVGGFLPFTTVRDVLAPAATTPTLSSDSNPETRTEGTTEAPEGPREVSPEAPAQGISANQDDPDRVDGDEPSEPDEQLEARTLEARAALDELLVHGVVRRGLLLGCRLCAQLNFVPVDQLGQNNDCQRCGSTTTLVQDAWRIPAAEPTWFYDLHPVARAFVKDNGAAPLWLAHHLAGGARDYTDCAELNLVLPGTRTSRAEADLIAHVDGVLIVAEVKTTDSLGTRAELPTAARKRVLWAAVLHADEIVLATTRAAWQPKSVDAMRGVLQDAIREGVFAPTITPRLRLVTGLHTSDVDDRYVEL